MKIKCPLCQRMKSNQNLLDHFNDDHGWDETIEPFADLIIKIHEKITEVDEIQYKLDARWNGYDLLQILKSLLE